MTETTDAGRGGSLSLTRRLFDSALLTAIAGGAASFAGWTSRMAYFGYFGLDPSLGDVTAIAMGSEGLIAIVLAFWTWLDHSMAAITGAMIAMTVVFMVASRVRRRGFPRAERTGVDRAASVFGNALALSAVLLLMFASGTIHGRGKAKDLIAARDAGDVLTYHFADAVLHGLPITATADRIWLLTGEGVRVIRTELVCLVDGPLYVRTGVIRRSDGKAADDEAEAGRSKCARA